MALPGHLEEAAGRLNEASWRVDQACEKPPALENLQKWLNALTHTSLAITEIQEFNSERTHEKCHEIAGRVGLKRL